LSTSRLDPPWIDHFPARPAVLAGLPGSGLSTSRLEPPWIAHFPAQPAELAGLPGSGLSTSPLDPPWIDHFPARRAVLARLPCSTRRVGSMISAGQSGKWRVHGGSSREVPV
jgi:hypothetical protein